jgi:PTS system mannose-specific IIC component
VTESTVLPLALLGGIVGLDVVSFPQAMWSRPIVAATLGGALAGDPARGLLAGVVLEMLAMEMLPVGASRYPEWGTASVVGGAIAAAAPFSAGELVLGVMVALATAWAGGWSMHGLRRLNGMWSMRTRAALEAGDTSIVTTLQLRGLATDFVRGAALTAAAMLIARPLVDALATRCIPSAGVALGTLAALAVAVAGSAVWRNAPATRGVRLAAVVALAIGISLAVVR